MKRKDPADEACHYLADIEAKETGCFVIYVAGQHTDEDHREFHENVGQHLTRERKERSA